MAGAKDSINRIVIWSLHGEGVQHKTPHPEISGTNQQTLVYTDFILVCVENC